MSTLVHVVSLFEGFSVVVPQCYMLLCPDIMCLLQYDHLNNSCLLCFLFSSVL